MAAVLAAIRAEGGNTQPQLTQLVGLGRSVVAQRVAELEAAGLVVQAGVAPSTEGGRLGRCGCDQRRAWSPAPTFG